jgi:1-deoxy-D-xylulose-5-phosphate synthase
MNDTSEDMLGRIDSPAELRQLAPADLWQVARDVRRTMIGSVSRSGGHLSAGLGVVELTVALHYVYDTPRDALVWDVGHQAYPHKILSGRRDRLGTIRRRGGLSGFLRRDESPYDAFGAGHSSTSIGAALGIAMARRAQRSDARAVAIIGDGAMTAGMAFEALQHAGDLDADLLVVLNDNGMSISPNVGSLSTHLSSLAGTSDVPPLFEGLGFRYTGPVDGHDVEALVAVLRELRKQRGPRLLHVVTRKGCGYDRAEADPVRYHGVTAFDPATGLAASARGAPPTFTQVFGDWLCGAAAADPRVIAITPAMKEGSGLVEFAQRHPERFFDVGIAEQHAVTFAAGLASQGMRPVVAIYSTFLQRAYDQWIHDVCIQGLPVVLAIDRAGLVGPDGATHNGAMDLSFLRCVPGMTVMAPSDESELRAMLDLALTLDGPSSVRFPRASALPADPAGAAEPSLVLGQARTIRRGSHTAFLAFGTLLHPALEAARAIDATVVDMRFVKPLDEQLIATLARTHSLLVSVEENVLAGGAGSAVAEVLARQAISTPLLQLGLPDRHIEHGTRDECLHDAGLDAGGILEATLAHPAAARRRRPAERRAWPAERIRQTGAGSQAGGT